jgi:hypothetical protein
MPGPITVHLHFVLPQSTIMSMTANVINKTDAVKWHWLFNSEKTAGSELFLQLAR